MLSNIQHLPHTLYYTDHIHCNSKAAGVFSRQIHFNGSGFANDNTFKELFTFFEKAFGRTCDIDGYYLVGRGIEKAEWSYKVARSESDHRIFLTEKAYNYFSFWYNKPALKVA